VHFRAKTWLYATLYWSAAMSCYTDSVAQDAKADAALRPADVQTAVETLRHDPNLRRDKTIRSLHWVAGKDKAPPPDAPGWIVSLFRFLSESASLLMWVAGAIGLAVAAVWVFRVVKSRQAAPPPATVPGVSRIQNLDIDPDSLPADVGASALSLLEAGHAREALSLLYRGALSRIVHRFAVAVGESFTEGEALRAVQRRLDAPRVQYFSSLVALWQRVVYAAEAPAVDSVAMLCRSFAPIFDGAANLAAGNRGAANRGAANRGAANRGAATGGGAGVAGSL
jgi:hypothetical protein